MPKVLLVEDDPDQLEIRSLLLRQSGHDVVGVDSAADALRVAREERPSLVVMDLRLPRSADGLRLIEALRALQPSPRIVVLTGWTADLAAAPEVDVVLTKPVRTPELLKVVARLAVGVLLSFSSLLAESIELAKPAEVLAEITIAGPAGSSWEQNPPPVRDLLIDGQPRQQVMLYAGAKSHQYNVFLGQLPAGRHEVTLPGASLRLCETNDPVVLHAPVLFERKNAIGKFSDIPLLTYAEWLQEEGQKVLQYSVIFSNEDGGTSTRYLMARWGRTTDIEFVYKVYFRPDGSPARAIIQGRGHKDLVFTGPYEGRHPLLMPVTDNNMVAGEGPSAVRYQPAPVLATLDSASREAVMDTSPYTWQVMIQELIREGKLRQFGTERGEDISDPRNYLYLEMNIRNQQSRMAAMVRLRGEQRWRTSFFGMPGAAIERDGWVRTTIELPPGTEPGQVAEVGVQCLAADKVRQLGACSLLSIGKAFFLTKKMTPAPSFWEYKGAPVELRVGEVWSWNLSSR